VKEVGGFRSRIKRLVVAYTFTMSKESG
jgi:hypothetical protein